MLAETSQPKDPGPRLPNRLPKWEIGGSDFGIFAALLFSTMVVVSSLFARVAEWLTDAEADAAPSRMVILAGNLGMQVGMLLAYVGFMIAMRAPRQDSTRPARPTPLKSLAIGLKWLLLSYPIMIGVNLVWRLFLGSQGYEQVTQDPIKMVQEGGSFAERMLIYTMIVLVAPVCEELVFRGAIFRYLHHRFPLAVAIAVSGFLFGLIHLNLYSFAPLMVIGVTLALAYRESGSIVSPIAFHSAFNTLNLLLILFFPKLQ